MSDPLARRAADVRFQARTVAPPGAMGALLDVVTLAVNSAFSAAALGVSIAQWRETHGRQGPAVTVEYPDGTRITVNGPPPQDATALLPEPAAGPED